MPASMANNPKVVFKKMVISALLISSAMPASIIIKLLYFLKYLLKVIYNPPSAAAIKKNI